MANRFSSPNQQFVSNLGVPYSGGKLYFYATGTSTPQNTYSNSALSIANTNPVVLDSAGNAGSIFLQNLAYKVVLTDSNNNPIWTEDPVYTSDYSAFARFQPYNGNPNGFVAGTAGTVGTLPGTSAVWDYTNNILYICTTTGTAASAVWTAVNSAAATTTTPTPQGYLTVNSDPNNPVCNADFASQTAVYYTPFVGNQIPVYNGVSFVTTTFTQLSLALTASQAANTLYDCFVFRNSGVLTLVTGPAWTTSTAGAGARGTGASTTQLSRLNGLWVNTVQITGRNGANSYTIAANTATYVGTIFIDSAAGQVTCHRSWGQNRKFGVWNAYNRMNIAIRGGDSTASWNYNTNTIRAANGSSNNKVTTLCGLPEEQISCQELQWTTLYNANQGGGSTVNQQTNIGIGVNSTTVMSNTRGLARTINGLSTGQFAMQLYSMATAQAIIQPGIGINDVYALETSPEFTGVTPTNNTFFGTETDMVLSAQYRG